MQARIAILPGDGIGPDVTREATRVLSAVSERWHHSFALSEGLIGGCAIDSFGTPLPDDVLRLCHESDAVLLGAVGGPKWDGTNGPRPEQGLLSLRRDLGLFANLRPVKGHPALNESSPLRPELLDGVDIMIVRELTGGIYFGEKRLEKVANGERATDTCSYATDEIERIARVAGGLALRRRGKVTSVDKANVLETSRLWRSVATRVIEEEFPEVTLEHILVDACAMRLIATPADFDVIVTENMFGDILSDEAAIIVGSLGVLPSASLGGSESRDGRSRKGLYEPIHGSAPNIAGKGIANPIGSILSVAMLLRHSLGLEAEAIAIEEAVSMTLENHCTTADVTQKGYSSRSTEEVGIAVAELILTASTPSNSLSSLSL